MPLVEVDGHIFDALLLEGSHGHERLDLVGQEAFVNHVHITGVDRMAESARLIDSWISEMCSAWPDRNFRIYRSIEPNEVTLRFHVVRPGVPNWCEHGVEIITVPSDDNRVP